MGPLFLCILKSEPDETRVKGLFWYRRSLVFQTFPRNRPLAFFLKENFSNSKICVVHISVLHRYFFTDVKKYRHLMTGSSLAKIGL